MKKLFYALLVLLLPHCREGAHQEALAGDSANGTVLTAKTSRISTSVSQGERVRKVLANLDTIELGRKLIISTAAEKKVPETEKAGLINEEISRLNDIIARNHEEILILNQRLKDVDQTETYLIDSIMMLSQKLAETESALEDMEDLYVETEEEYRAIEWQLYTLLNVNTLQKRRIWDLTDSAFYAYYIVATESYLLDHGIIKSSAGKLNFDRTKEFDPNARTYEFVRLDQRKTSVILIGRKKAHVVTKHPDRSYRLETKDGIVKRLVVLDPSEFWKASRYLVIATK